MTQATNSDAAAAAKPARWPQLLLFLAALLELFEGLGALPILAGDLNEIPGPGLGGNIIIASIILKPAAAAAALFFLVRSKLSWALVSMAFVILAGWINYLPSIQLHGIDFIDASGAPVGDWFTTAMLAWQIFLAPALALAVASLALAEKRLPLASVLAVLPTAFRLLSVVVFGIGVAIYGF